MINIYVEGRMIELPSDISFEYVAENRLFSNADGYSFDIEIPLKDSKINSEIFGVIWHPQTDIDTLKFNAQLVTQQISLSGIVAIVGVSESKLSIQFLEGRSAQNFEKDLQEKYINELELGRFNVPPATDPPTAHWRSSAEGAEAVAIPWVNNNSESGIIQNNVIKSGDQWTWDPDNFGLSYMPYLTVLIRKICSSIGYDCDISPLENSRFKDLLVCNALPAALGIDNYDEALPHWTVSEFFDNLEIILQGEFDIDNVSKSIYFRFTADILRQIEPVTVKDVVDEYSVELDTMNDDRSNLELMRNIAFKDNGSRFGKLQSCDWFIDLRKKNPLGAYWMYPGAGPTVDENGHRHYPPEATHYESLVVFDTLAEFLKDFRTYEFFGMHRNDIIQRNIYYARDCDCYFIFHSAGYNVWILDDPDHPWCHHFEAMPINEFGKYIVDPENIDDAVELSTVPVPIDEAEFKCAFLTFSNSSEDSTSGDPVFEIEGDSIPLELEKVRQPDVYNTIADGQSEKSEYFDKLLLGFWPGYKPYHDEIGIRPITSNVVIYDYFKAMFFPDFSLRLNNGFSRGTEEFMSIDAKKLYKFSFFADNLPSTRATFFIHGKRYICSKLSVQISADGFSNLIKGEFYRF